ncbi:choice-of-anchor D domain-containing protein [candidate division KSB1 bacterium]|nr:choice-of-anchor D domain-containing protein [candidate division KSB1 bacterium]
MLPTKKSAALYCFTFVLTFGFSTLFSQPVIVTNRTQLNFGALPGVWTNGQTVLVDNASTGTLNWTATPGISWITVMPTAGTGAYILTVSVDPAGMSTGTYSGLITISDPGAINSPQTVNVNLTIYNPGATSPPFGVFDTPLNGSTVRGSIPVTGWALDDIGVENVKIYRQDGGSLVYIADATFIEGARPDVEVAYPNYPNNYKASWGYMLLTYILPNGGNGTFTLHAIATDMEGNQVTLGIKTITCDNANAVKPFGTLDTPAQGGTASGSSYAVWGWTLTPQPNMIPTDGSTIHIWVDGVNLGHPIYNIYRSDIAAMFPGYANSNGAVFLFYLDTTIYSNGLHVIQVTVVDNAGNADGIGARYFTIINPTGGPEMRVLGNGNLIANLDYIPSTADGTDFGDICETTGSKNHPFVIQNVGTDNLILNGSPLVDLTGPNATDFSVVQPGISTIPAGGGETSFQIIFNPSSAGVKKATVIFENTDITQDPYSFAIWGRGLTDSDGDGIADGTEGTGDRDGDNVPDNQDYDPSGWIYNEANGQIISGGTVQVTPSAGVTIIEDGTNGYYQFIVSQAGDYTILYTPPAGYLMSGSCPAQSGPLDPAPADPNPLIVGVGTRAGTSDQMTDWTCGNNPWYTVFRLEPGDPVIINNNIPLRQPIDIQLTSYTASADGDKVTLAWKTESEINCAGFYIHRRFDKNTDYLRLNKSIIPACGNRVSGSAYEYVDSPPSADGIFYYKLEEIGFNGKSTFYGPVTVTMKGIPKRYAFLQNYPNPFNPETRIKFDVVRDGFVSINIYDITGKQVRTLVAEQKSPGSFTVVWDGRDDAGVPVAGGIYLCEMQAWDYRKIIKMVLAK